MNNTKGRKQKKKKGALKRFTGGMDQYAFLARFFKFERGLVYIFMLITFIIICFIHFFLCIFVQL